MSGRTALMNLATRLMRNRTELMFQVVSVRRKGNQKSAFNNQSYINTRRRNANRLPTNVRGAGYCIVP
jgi:hypothetical protein